MKYIRHAISAWLFAMCVLWTPSAFALAVNDAVQATAALNVRATASTSGTLITTKPLGSVGRIGKYLDILVIVVTHDSKSYSIIIG